MQLTKDADKMLCCLYKEYLERRKLGNSKRDSKRFSNEYTSSDPILSTWHKSDISDTILELGQKGFLKVYIGGDFDLTDMSIIYMENRFKNNISEISDFISKFIP